MEAGQGIETTRSNWVFDEKVAPHFDEHVRKSVPDYDRIQDLAASFADWFLQDGGTVIDLGASTGETLLRIQSRNPQKDIKVIGYDNSRAMIQQAKAKGVDVHFCDLSMLTQISGHDYGVSLYTLQFLRPGAKQTVLSVCYDSLKRGGGFIRTSRSVSITCATAGAAIEYAKVLVGNPAPSTGWIAYTGAFTVFPETRVWARTTASGLTASDYARADFYRDESIYGGNYIEP